MDPRLVDLAALERRPAASWRERGWWGRPPMWERVRDVAATTPGKSAVIDGDEVLSYGALWEHALRQAAAMRRSGLARGDIILVQLPNWHEFVILAVAAETAGIVLAFCPIQWDLRETLRALRLTRPRIWVTTLHPWADENRASLISEVRSALGADAPRTVLVRSREAESGTAFDRWAGDVEINRHAPVAGARGPDPLEIAVTSGSTGDPKGVLHVHDSAIAAIDSTISRQGIGPSDIIHLAVPVGHTFGYFYGVRCAMQSRACLLMQSRWDPQVMVDLAAKHRFTVSLGPSAFVIDLLRLDRARIAPLSSIRLFTLSGDSLPAPVVRNAIETLPFRISRALGMTEFGHASSTDAHTPRAALIETVGTPQPEMTFRIRGDDGRDVPAGAEGRIVVSGPFLFAGYLSPERLDQDVLDASGFFDTGDLGAVDASGYLRITGRIKNVIRRGAETIPVSMIEDVIASHPDVVHAVVVGVPDERLGELPVACVQLKSNHKLTIDDINRLFEREKITRRYWPSELHIFERWPIGPTGKIDRRRIVAELGKQA
jgi:acyl-CoA synthetase (AMP-forming)/AMP-acid ligase II